MEWSYQHEGNAGNLDYKALPNFVIAIIMTSGALMSYIFIKIYPTEILICRYNCKELNG
jgi:hypothetical protein